MKRLYVAKANGEPKFLIVDNDIYTVEPFGEAPVLPPAAPVAETAPRARGRKPGGKRAVRRAKDGRKVRTCSKCGEPGHMAKTCGRESDDPQEAPHSQPRTIPPHPAQMDDAEIETRVHEMQNEGMSSITIAAKLHVPLKTVNKFWRNRTAELQS